MMQNLFSRWWWWWWLPTRWWWWCWWWLFMTHHLPILDLQQIQFVIGAGGYSGVQVWNAFVPEQSWASSLLGSCNLFCIWVVVDLEKHVNRQDLVFQVVVDHIIMDQVSSSGGKVGAPNPGAIKNKMVGGNHGSVHANSGGGGGGAGGAGGAFNFQ